MKFPDLSMILSLRTFSRQVVCLMLLVLVAGCGLKKPDLQRLKGLPAGNICRIAVLPMVNESGYRLGDTIFYRIFMAELIRSGNFQVSQEGDVRNIYRQLKIIPGQLPDGGQIKILADQLEAQLVITGAILEMDEKQMQSNVNPVLAVSISCMDPKSGDTLWTTYHRRSGGQYRKILHFGVVNTLTELSQVVSQEILDHWFHAGGMKRCSD